MANEEIEISELEFREELSGDDLIPVETSTNTFATTLIAIKNWLKSFFVGKTGDEEINGIKTFLKEIKSNVGDRNRFATIKALDLDRSTTPSQDKNIRIFWVDDKNNTELMGFFTGQQNNGRNFIKKYIIKNNKNVTAALWNDGENGWFEVPQSDKTNSAITTSGISKNTNGYVKLGNGIMIQWFSISANSTITFPTAFPNMCGFVSIVDGSANSCGISNITKTGCTYSQSYNFPREVHGFAIGY